MEVISRPSGLCSSTLGFFIWNRKQKRSGFLVKVSEDERERDSVKFNGGNQKTRAKEPSAPEYKTSGPSPLIEWSGQPNGNKI